MKKLFLFILFVLFLYSCGDTEESEQSSASDLTATLTYTPDSGYYENSKSVSITITASLTADNFTVHYTTDGSTPTCTSSTYTKPVVLNDTNTGVVLKAVVCMEQDSKQYIVSDIKVATYTFTTFSWNEVGTGSGSGTVSCGANSCSYVGIKFSSTNIPYLHANQNVFKLNTATKVWEQLGTAPSTAASVMVLDSNDTPYIVKRGTPAHVYKFNGTDWTELGTEASTDGSSHLSFIIDENDTPLLAYKDGYSSPARAIVSRYIDNGSSLDWHLLDGTDDTSDTEDPSASDIKVEYINLALNSNNKLYIAFKDKTNNLLVLRTYNNTTGDWEAVTSFSSGLKKLSMLIGSDDNIYVAYVLGDIYVKKYDGTHWTDLGTFSPVTSVSELSLREYNGTFYLAYIDTYDDGSGTSENHVIVARYNGSTWEQLGNSPGISYDEGTTTSRPSNLGIDENGIVYVVFQSDERETTVKRYYKD